MSSVSLLSVSLNIILEILNQEDTECDNLIVSKGHSYLEAFVLLYYILDLKDTMVLALRNNLVSVHACVYYVHISVEAIRQP